MRRSDVGMNTRVELATDGSDGHAERYVVHLHADGASQDAPAAISFSDVNQVFASRQGHVFAIETISLGVRPKEFLASSDQAAAENRPSSD